VTWDGSKGESSRELEGKEKDDTCSFFKKE
jgi:hypothetical protein